MSIRRRVNQVLAASSAIVAFGAADAALVSRLGGLAVYDTTRDLLWLADANYLGASSFSSVETMLSGVNTSGLLGFSDWRLPSTTFPDANCSSPDGTGTNGFNCTASEMGHLFYEELGGIAGTSILLENNGQLSLFENTQPGYYWSSTASPIYPGPFSFVFGTGLQDASNNPDSPYSSWLVRSGDVLTVPEPAGWTLALVAVCILAFSQRARSSKAKG